MSVTRKVTSLEIQKAKKNRVSVFLDGAFAFGLDQDVLVKSGIARGDELSDERVAEILDLEERHRAKLKAMRLLAVRARSRRELADRLAMAKFSTAVIDAVLQELERLQLIDDNAFARSFSQNRMATRPAGKMLLQRELKQKGLSETEINTGLAKAYENQTESQVARTLAEKRKKSCGALDERKAKQRVSDFLLRRGFSWDVVSEVLEDWDQF